MANMPAHVMIVHLARDMIDEALVTRCLHCIAGLQTLFRSITINWGRGMDAQCDRHVLYRKMPTLANYRLPIQPHKAQRSCLVLEGEVRVSKGI